MTTEYQLQLDRDACDGVFACLVRDDRFVEASDGLAVIDVGSDDEHPETDPNETQKVTVTDDQLAAARQAARACPVDAIDVMMEDSDE